MELERSPSSIEQDYIGPGAWNPAYTPSALSCGLNYEVEKLPRQFSFQRDIIFIICSYWLPRRQLLNITTPKWDVTGRSWLNKNMTKLVHTNGRVQSQLVRTLPKRISKT